MEMEMRAVEDMGVVKILTGLSTRASPRTFTSRPEEWEAETVIWMRGVLQEVRPVETGGSWPYFSLRWLMRVGQNEGRTGGQGWMAGGRWPSFLLCYLYAEWIAISP